jgi:hypothetical protein
MQCAGLFLATDGNRPHGTPQASGDVWVLHCYHSQVFLLYLFTSATYLEICRLTARGNLKCGSEPTINQPVQVPRSVGLLWRLLLYVRNLGKLADRAI